MGQLDYSLEVRVKSQIIYILYYLRTSTCKCGRKCFLDVNQDMYRP